MEDDTEEPCTHSHTSILKLRIPQFYYVHIRVINFLFICFFVFLFFFCVFALDHLFCTQNIKQDNPLNNESDVKRTNILLRPEHTVTWISIPNSQILSQITTARQPSDDSRNIQTCPFILTPTTLNTTYRTIYTINRWRKKQKCQPLLPPSQPHHPI